MPDVFQGAPPVRSPRPVVLIESPALSGRLGARVTLACETFQYTGSFKFRAAYHLAESAPQMEFVTASSGNFGQALAYACKLLHKRCTVVMPSTSAQVKIEAVRRYGAHVEIIDTRTVQRAQRVSELAARMPDAYVASAYDDPYVIEGNATLGHELAACGAPFDDVVVPVGGGGLASGTLLGLRRDGATAQVFGAEPLLGNDAALSLRSGAIVSNAVEPATIADGARTVSLGRRNWEILRTGLAGIVEVPERDIVEAVRLLFGEANIKAEPTGALSVGALLTEPSRFSGRSVCCVVSGGNVDPAAYARLIWPEAAHML